MYEQLCAAVRRDLNLAALLWRHRPQEARRLVDAAGEVIYWMHYQPPADA